MDSPTYLALTQDAISPDDLIARITTPGTGAVVLFTGIVRGITTHGETRQTSHLDYEAYSPMAEEKMKQICVEIRERWSAVEGIAIAQRIGQLDAGTITTVIACSAGHRDSGVFEAARYGIDRLKEIVPIWKKETGPDGASWVEGHYHPAAGE